VSICINPHCPTPNHPTNSQNRFCQSCGTTLLLSNRYRGTKLISDSSGFGIIYSAVDNTGTAKILKVLKGNLNNHGKAVELFEKEAEVLSRLTHPGIPKVYGYFTVTPGNSSGGETPLLRCIVMEKIDGLNLDEWMQQRQHQPLTQSLALEWMQQITEILHLVHQQQYFHRDIKPPNIMRRENGQLVLIDFGTAREVTTTYLVKVGGAQHRVTGVVTAGYTPQEQINGKAVPQSDFYALGRTFVFLLTGKEPTDFEEDPRTGQLLWRRSAATVSKHLADLIDDLMQPFPGNRPKNTDEILKRLDNVSRKLHPSTPPPIPPQSQQNLNPPPQPPPLRRQPSQSQRKWLVRGAVIYIGVQTGSLFFLNQHSLPQKNFSNSTSPPPINSSPPVSYSRLRTLLAAGKWKEADRETTSVIREVAGRGKEGWFDANSLRNFPKDDLRTIEQLWLKYSKNRFGFSVQKKIRLYRGGEIDGEYDWDTYVKVADAVGWRKRGRWLYYSDLTFNTSAPAGHLPTLDGWWGNCRVVECSMFFDLFFSIL